MEGGQTCEIQCDCADRIRCDLWCRRRSDESCGGGRDCIKEAGNKARGAVLASDAFLPFGDTVEAAGKAGITAVIQPGGSIRDGESVEMADHYGIAMVFTEHRHFLHG